MYTNRTVVAIPPSFDSTENIEFDSTLKYLDFLYESGVKTVMSTAGTSQFNLQSLNEIHAFNCILASRFIEQKILGIPILNLRDAKIFIEYAEKNYVDSNTSLLALYPDRYYDDESILYFLSKLRELSSKPLYLHGMKMRNARGGEWNYSASLINKLFENDIIAGIKEEHGNFKKSYDFVSELNSNIDTIVAGGSMRRHQYLNSAGANAFLAGIGNIFPNIEINYCRDIDLNNSVQRYLELETKFFNIFMKYGWHQSLRVGLSEASLTCFNDRKPWPLRDQKTIKDIKKIIEEISNEK